MSADTLFTDITIYSDRYVRYPHLVAANRKTFDYEIKGRCIPDQAGNLMEVMGEL